MRVELFIACDAARRAHGLHRELGWEIGVAAAQRVRDAALLEACGNLERFVELLARALQDARHGVAFADAPAWRRRAA